MDSPCRPDSHHRDGSHPQEEAQIQDAGRHPSPGRAGLTVCPVQALGPWAARRARRGVGAASSQRCPHPSAPASAARSRTHFLHRRGPPPRTQVGTKRGKRSRMAGVRRSRPRAAGECSQGLPMDRHPIPRKAFSRGAHTAMPWERGQQEAMCRVWDLGQPSRAGDSRVGV